MKLCKCSTIIYSFSFICGCLCVNSNPRIAEESTYSAAEKKSLVELRNRVKAELYQDYMHRDEYLIPWLRAKKLDVNQARNMLLRALKWRKENKIDSIGEEEFPQFQGFKFDTQSRDKDGRPVIFLTFGTWNVRKAVLAGETQNLTRYLVKVLLEDPSQLSRKLGQASGKNCTQIVLVNNLNGYNLRQHGCVACLPIYVTAIQNAENYYPQILKEYAVLNTPSIFNTVIQITKPFYSEHLTKHLHVIGHDNTEIRQLLKRFIPLDQIPVQFGGTNSRKIA